jgi:hypothetical protein
VDLLVHRGDPEPLGVLRGADRDASSVHENFARIGLVHTAQDLDQRRLASAILTDERVDLSFAQREGDAVQRPHARKRLVDGRRLEEPL